MIVDTETTGLPVKNAHPNETNKFPYIVQLSYVIIKINAECECDCDCDCECDCEIIKKVDNIIRVPDDVVIEDVVVKIHGISNEISKKKGIYIETALSEFIKDAKEMDLIIAHNAYFDMRVIRAELHRILNNCRPSNRSCDKMQMNIDFIRNTKNVHCTMLSNIKLCNVKGISKYGNEFIKFPKLSELHNHLFHYVPNNLHNSFNDVIVCLRCFMKIRYDVDIFEKKDKTIQKMKALL